jgi:hypothetical protein
LQTGRSIGERKRVGIATTAAIDAMPGERQGAASCVANGDAVIARLFGAAALSMSATAALAGPPYATDDPEPTDTGHWEIYAFGAGTKAHGSFDGAAGVDLNYGPVPDVQLTATLPIDFTSGGGNRTGFGDVELGIKYRFFHDEAAGISVAIFPRAILPTATRGFGTGRVQLLLPVWAQKDFGPWSLFGGGGYTINPGAGNRDFWQTGLALTRNITPRLSLGAEITHQSPDAAGARSTTALGLGGIYHVAGPFSLLFSGGPVFEHRGGTDVNAYAALGLSF